MPAPPQAAHLSTSASVYSDVVPSYSEAPFSSTATAASLSSSSTSSSSSSSASSSSQAHRPIHLLRAPSYQPPAFDADHAPPPIEVVVPRTSLNTVSTDHLSVLTPPPHYDAVFGTPSHDARADYFSRLADYGIARNSTDSDGTIEDEEDDDDESRQSMDRPRLVDRRSGRVNVINPRTPGPMRLPSRSLDIQRPTFELSFAGVASRTRGSGTGTGTGGQAS